MVSLFWQELKKAVRNLTISPRKNTIFLVIPTNLLLQTKPQSFEFHTYISNCFLDASTWCRTGIYSSSSQMETTQLLKPEICTPSVFLPELESILSPNPVCHQIMLFWPVVHLFPLPPFCLRHHQLFHGRIIILRLSGKENSGAFKALLMLGKLFFLFQEW